MSTATTSKYLQRQARPGIPRGTTAARFIAALVLILAAALKLHQWVRYPGGTDIGAAWLAGQIAAEWLLACWLISGARVKLATIAAIIAFTAFAIWNMYHGLSGRQDCGCWGTVEISPWLSFTIDLGVVFMLGVFFPRRRLPMPARLGFQSLVGFVAIAGAAVAAGIVSTTQPAKLQGDGQIEGEEKQVVVNTASWEGQTLPLLNHIDIAEQLKTGLWKVVFYRNNCTACQDELKTTIADSQKNDKPQVALVEVPPFTDAKLTKMDKTRVVPGRLSDKQDWILTTPLVVNLQDGKVVGLTSAAKTTPSQNTGAAKFTDSVPREKSPSHHFGYVEPQSTHHTVFVVKNPSDKTLSIKAIIAECSCTRVLFKPTEIPARGEVEVPVEFVPPAEMGEYSKRIFVVGNGTDPIATLQVRASIGLALGVEPSALTLPRAASEEISVTVVNHGTTAVRLLYSTSTIKGCTAVVPREPIAPGGSVKLPVRWSGTSDARSFDGILQIHTNDKRQPTLSVGLSTLKQ